MDFSFMSDNLSSFMGSGLLYILLLVSIVFLSIRLKKSASKTALVWFPVFVLAIFFCPIWFIYMKIRNDAEILYRILWMIPMGVIIAYAFVEAISMLPKKMRGMAFIVSLAIIMVSGRYVYANRQFSMAENVYHVPQTVVDICDELIVPGREVRVCFPIEMVQYVRQYTAYVCQPYGRDTLLWGVDYDAYSTIATFLDSEVIDAKGLTEELRLSDTPYLVVSENTKFEGNLADFDYYYVTTIDGYDIYLDNEAYLGTDYINYR